MNPGRLAILPVAAALVVGSYPDAAMCAEGRRSSVGLVGNGITMGLALSLDAPGLPVAFLGQVARTPERLPGDLHDPWTHYNWIAALRSCHVIDETSSWGLVGGARGDWTPESTIWIVNGLVGCYYDMRSGPWWLRLTPNIWLGWPIWPPYWLSTDGLFYLAVTSHFPLAEVGWDMGAGFTVSLRASYEPLAVTYSF